MFEQQSQKSDNRVTNPTNQTKVQKVEEILDSRWRGDKLQYLIKWKDQPLEERTWENRAKVIKGAPRLCKEFHQKHLDAPRVPVIRLPGKMYADIAERVQKGNCILGQTKPCCASSQLRAKGLRGDNQR